jgi:hypothetical protein
MCLPAVRNGNCNGWCRWRLVWNWRHIQTQAHEFGISHVRCTGEEEQATGVLWHRTKQPLKGADIDRGPEPCTLILSEPF